MPLDLHVLGTPPAFVLSQDQTLRCKKTTLSSPDISVCQGWTLQSNWLLAVHRLVKDLFPTFAGNRKKSPPKHARALKNQTFLKTLRRNVVQSIKIYVLCLQKSRVWHGISNKILYPIPFCIGNYFLPFVIFTSFTTTTLPTIVRAARKSRMQRVWLDFPPTQA